MQKCIMACDIKKYAYAVFPSGNTSLLCVYTDVDYAYEDIKKWQVVYDDQFYEDHVTCLLSDLPLPGKLVISN